MLWLKAFHIIFMVTWFSGLFYLPRLYVYHSEASDDISIARFKTMERRLYFGIMTPGALLTMFFGAFLWEQLGGRLIYFQWFQLKLLCVFLMVVYHIYLGRLYFAFSHNRNRHSALFYRILNEVPVFFLIAIVLLVVLKPQWF